jgi:hypothetical protein
VWQPRMSNSLSIRRREMRRSWSESRPGADWGIATGGAFFRVY